MKTFVVGDIHGNLVGFKKCLQNSKFDNKNDRLIALGDVCDRGTEVALCIEELLDIKNCVYIIGNHDLMALDWAEKGVERKEWLSQGGQMTIDSYRGLVMPQEHIDFLKHGKLWFEESGRMFVHAGFNPQLPISEQPTEVLVWDRTLVDSAWKSHCDGGEFIVYGYKEVFVGHTPTINFDSFKPIHWGNLWLLDTGAGYGHKMTIMDVETKEYWQSF